MTPSGIRKPNPPFWYSYILRCADGSLYTGVARSVKKRLADHQAGKGAKYTRGRGPLTLVYKRRHASRSAALRKEAAIKRLPRTEKERLIGGS